MTMCCFCTVFTGDESSTTQTGKVVTPPSSANGHVPHDLQENSANGSGVLESASGEQTNGGARRGASDSASPAEENANGLDNTVPENNVSSAPVSHGKVTSEEEQPVVVTSSTVVGEVGVPSASYGDDVKPEATEGKPSGIKDISFSDEPGVGAAETDLVQNKVASQVSLSGENETGPSLNQTNTASVTATDSGAAETDLAQHGVASEGSLAGEIQTTPVVDQSKRASVAASEHSAAPSDNDVNLSRQNRGSFELDFVSPTSSEGAQSSQPREVSKEDSASLGGKENSFPVEASGSSQPTEVSRKDSVALGRKDSVGHHAAANDDFFVKSESIHGRICTLTASVLIGSLDDPQGERTVTLHGSVYRLPGVTTPKPGDKIGFVTGDVTSAPVDNESSNKVATLRGDLLAVSGEAASHGQIATASIDVLSCATGEKVATITADVAPNDDSDSASGVISGEVLSASESGSYDAKIGTLAGKVVALNFDEDAVSVTSADEEFLKQRRVSCFI